MLRSGSSLVRAALGASCSSAASTSSLQQCSSFSSGAKITATLFPGDGVGPEIAKAAQQIFEAAGVPIIWDEQIVGKAVDPRTNSMVSRENLDSMLVSSSTPVMVSPVLGSSLSSCTCHTTASLLMLDA